MAAESETSGTIWQTLDAERVARLQADPTDCEAWDALAADVAREERPEELAAFGRWLLGRLDGSSDALAERVLRFHEEWFRDEAPEWLELIPLGLRLAPEPTEAVVARLTMGLTDAERWDELFALYDAASEALEDPEAKARLLEEAAQAAKDFAERPERAVDYYERLAALRPEDDRLAETLERLLRRLGRWDALIERWRRRLPAPELDEGLTERLRLAEALVEHGGDAGGAVGLLLETGEAWWPVAEAARFLERCAEREDLAREVRARAAWALARWHAAEGRDQEALGAYERAASLAAAPWRADVLAEWADWLHRNERWSEELRVRGLQVAEETEAGDVSSETVQKGREAARRADRLQPWAEQLCEVAARLEGASRLRLLAEAADVFEPVAPHRALEVLAALEAEDVPPEERPRLWARRVRLLEALGREQEALDLVARLVEHHDQVDERRRWLARGVAQAERMGRMDLVAAFWRAEAERVPQDEAPFAAWLQVLERTERWSDLAEALRWRLRCEGLSGESRRQVRDRLIGLLEGEAGDLEEARRLAEEALREEGPGEGRADRLARILAALGRREELAALWQEEALRARERFLEARHAQALVLEEAGDLRGAMALHAESLRLAPGRPAAREALRRWIDDERVGKEAALLLARDARERGDREAWLQLVPHVWEAEEDPDARVAWLRAGLAEWEARGEAERVFWAMSRLAEASEEAGRWAEALDLSERLLSMAQADADRTALALTCTRLFERIEAGGTPSAWLAEVLEREPGHEEALQWLQRRLSKQGRWAELVEHFERLAGRLEALGESERASVAWRRVAEWAEERLSDPERAAAAWRRLTGIAPSAQAFSHLARLSDARGETSQVVHWLERWWREFPEEAGPRVAARLADALRETGRPERAMEVLRTAFAEHPDDDALVGVLEKVVEELSNPRERAEGKLILARRSEGREAAALALQAAELLAERVGDDLLVEALGVAHHWLPDDADLAIRYAEAAFEAEEFDRASEVLGGLFERFGRRRTPQRARAHRLAARLAEAKGDLETAQAQLEAASEVDRSDPETLRALALLARRRGDLERAERVYRSLLLAVRRARGELPWTVSELMWELSSLAAERGDQEQAEERLESSLAAAERDDREAERLARAAVEAGEYAVALRAIEARVQGSEGQLPAVLLRLRAQALQSLGRGEEAFDVALDALRAAPGDEETRAFVRRLAVEEGTVGRLLDVLRSVAEEAGTSAEAIPRWFAVAEVAEEDAKDMGVALDAVQRARAAGAAGVDTWLHLARLAKRLGERALQREALERVAEDESAPADARAEALRELAAWDPSDEERVVSLLRRAMAMDPSPAPCLQVLRAAAEAGAAGADFDVLYGEVARALRDDAEWLGYLCWRAGRPDAGVRTVREALQEAERQDDPRAREAMLERLVQVAAAESDVEAMREAMLALAESREAAGDVLGAIEWMRKALEVVTEEGEARFELQLRLATLAGREGGDVDLAKRLYEELLGIEPTEERLWAPLLSLLRAGGEEDALRDWVERVTDAVLEPAARNRARMQLAGFYLDRGPERMAEAIAVLRHVVDEEPDHEEGMEHLTRLYEQAGYDDELSELLWRRLDAALDRGDRETAVRVGTKLAALLVASERTQDAADVYRRLLDGGVEDRDVLEHYLSLVDPDEEADLALEIGERLLQLEEGEAASRRACWLAERHAARGDEAARRRVLRLGLERAPHDEALAEALARVAADDGDPEALVALLLSRAERSLRSDPDAARGAFLEAAQVRLERLEDVEGAAAVLARSREIWPEDPNLLGLEVDLLRRSGRDEEAAERLEEALRRHETPDARRAELLCRRAELALDAEDWERALGYLQEAASIDPEGTVPLRVRALAGWRSASAAGGDRESERSATLRLAEALEQAGDVAQAHDLLRAWSTEHPDDGEALAARERIERAHGLEDALMETLTMRLERAEAPDACREAALRLFDTAQAAERLEDARKGLETACARLPGDETLFSRLLALYEAIGAHRERAALLLERADRAESEADTEAAFEALYRAGESFLEAGDPEAATGALRRASELRADDSRCVVVLADALAAWEQFSEAARVLQDAIERHPRRRSPELGELQYAMARLARRAGDRGLEYQWLQAAFEADKQNLAVASELAERAVQEGDFPLATKALRAVTMGKGDAPMSRGRAYLLQAKIALQQGEARRALLYARKAKSEEPSLPEIDELLRDLGS